MFDFTFFLTWACPLCWTLKVSLELFAVTVFNILSPPGVVFKHLPPTAISNLDYPQSATSLNFSSFIL